MSEDVDAQESREITVAYLRHKLIITAAERLATRLVPLVKEAVAEGQRAGWQTQKICSCRGVCEKGGRHGHR